MARKPRYGIVDTTFATVNMGDAAAKALASVGITGTRVVQRTVPGFKDLAVAALQMVRDDKCDIVIACGMPGPEPIDKQCSHEASMALGQAQLMVGKHILEVFVHMDEADDDAELIEVCQNRVTEHALNAYWMLERPEELRRRAGTGQRQGFPDVGPARPGGKEGHHLKPSERKRPRRPGRS